MLYPNLDLSEMFAARQSERSELHAHYLNEQLVRVLKTIGYDVGFKRGSGQYLYDRQDARYLDLLSGFGVFAVGRNHPVLRRALTSVLDSELPNLVQMDVSTLAGILAERLLERVPHLDKAFFANSGTEAVEAAIKFARSATGRTDILYCGHAYHGLTYGSLSLTDDMNFRGGFEPLLPGCTQVPFNNLAALEKALSTRQVAAFIVEPIQGKGVNMPNDEFLPEAAALCRRYGTLFVADEVQTGLGRTGRFLAVEHWNVEPDMVLLAKALSGGHVPVGAVLTRKWIFDKIFDRMDRAVVHGSTFGKNDLAMAAGIATLEVLKQEKLIENAQAKGERLQASLGRMVQKYELVKDVRGKGLMVGIQFGAPKSLALKASWNVLETASKGLFCQLITIPLFKDHKILTQVSGHASHTIKLLPSLTITDEDCQWIESGFDAVISASHRVPGAVWSLGKTLVDNAMRKSA
ncbi:aspartate aminotransferase family protein [Bradyrhizobium sp. WD16]|uniref:aspartate aminotransferase family protein n=1 Tax=Bradyrhizobium sp. WD16 TaxID=1521768 RepID=UPI0020A2AEDA|nr:aspartate aminotransferase family protein [Bradyrhizobium sp. WD16]UTD26409.1 aspartate aminotransferase family protein [Bradyrhizobium sp. WD16]